MKQQLVSEYRRIKHGLADVVYRRRAGKLRTSEHRRRLVVFYLFADTRKYPHSLGIVEEALDRMYGFDVTLVSINNFDETAAFQQIAHGRYLSPGDNSQWEFSGWKRGLRLFDALSLEADIALFVNDALMNLSTGGQDPYWFRNAFNSLTLQTLGHRALGHVHPAPKGHWIDGWKTGCFLQTHAFAMPYSVARRLPFTAFLESEWEQFLPTEFTGRWFQEDAPCSQTFQHDVRDYLTRRWHARRAFHADNWPVLRAKTIAMINERLFSQSLLNLDCPLINAGRVSLWTGSSSMCLPSIRRSDCGESRSLDPVCVSA